MMKWQKVLNQTLLYNRTEKTIGITYKVASGAAFKADYQFISNEAKS